MLMRKIQNCQSTAIKLYTHNTTLSPHTTYNCSMREKKELVPPLFIAEAKIARPSEEEKEIAVEGNTLRQNVVIFFFGGDGKVIIDGGGDDDDNVDEEELGLVADSPPPSSTRMLNAVTQLLIDGKTATAKATMMRAMLIEMV